MLHGHLLTFLFASPALRQPLLSNMLFRSTFFASQVPTAKSCLVVWHFFLLSGLVCPPPRSHEWSPKPIAAERTKEPVGPFRVYLQYSWSPGLACSRAFGDKMAVEVGVTHKPDVTMHTLMPEDRYLIVASDGVWELISSQVSSSTVQLCERFVHAAVLMQWRMADVAKIWL